MARKKAAAVARPPSPERVTQALATGDLPNAVAWSRELHQSNPSPPNLALRKRALAAAAVHFAEHDKPIEFNRMMAEADEVDRDSPEWLVERACLLARGGRLSDALMRVDDSTRPAVLGHAADRAIRTRTKEFIPDELHAGFDAVMAAFRHHESGNEAAAREALEPIGLRSPYLEWKVLLRGLLALGAGDAPRAAENFARLDPTRLPARLAEPVRFGIDAAFARSLPADAAARLRPQSDRLNASPLVGHLRDVARELGSRDRSLARAFRSAESALPQVRSQAPHLVPRLANCLYQAIIQQGQPDDLARYRRLFGNPADDPNFYKLQAQISEQIGDMRIANQFWQKYEAWLAANPPGWPAAVLDRARAMIWNRMGANVALAKQQEDEEDDFDPYDFFGPPRHKKKKPLPMEPPAEACYTRAAQLAPDWDVASRGLYNALCDAGKLQEGEAVLREFLALRPDNAGALRSLADHLLGVGKADEAAEYWLKTLAVNPLDQAMRSRAAVAILASARHKLAAGDAAEAEAILDRHAELLEDRDPAGSAALRSVVWTRMGRKDEAAALRDRALAVPGARLSAAYRIMVDSQLAKLKPADKRPADKLFAGECAKLPTPLEVNLLIGAYDTYHIERVSYRGQKSHEKKVLDQVSRCFDADAPEIDFEGLAGNLVIKHEWKRARALADACIRRFKRNPYFLLVRSEIGMETRESFFTIADRLQKAERLAEKSTEPRHQALLGKIKDLLKEANPGFGFLDSFFNKGPW